MVRSSCHDDVNFFTDSLDVPPGHMALEVGNIDEYVAEK